MSNLQHILAIDQGTTSSRAMLFDVNGRSIFTSQSEFRQIFPREGWVEHDPEEIWSTTMEACREAIAASAALGGQIAGIGITNQRETTVVWDRDTGKPIYNAIVWQDRRTAEHCANLRAEKMESVVKEKTGLLLDPYFSATKISWILDHSFNSRSRAEKGELAFGTIDTFLLWRLTGGKVHATDATNASRTLLFNIHDGSWDQELMDIFDVPAPMLPTVKDCSAEFGYTDSKLFGKSICVAGIAGDQQAAAVGQACFDPGMIKSTYGTGCFLLINTGKKPVTSDHRLLTTIAYRLDGETTYAVEGSIFSAGAAVQWLRDGLGIIESASETEKLAADLTSNKGVYLVPAFTGLGAPYWDADARGAMFGLTRDTGPSEIVRATLEAVCYQTYDLFKAMTDDGIQPNLLRVDGGMVNNNWLVQNLADVLDIAVQRPLVTETTALGAAFLAGLHMNMFDSLEDLSNLWQCEAHFAPDIEPARRDHLIEGWRQAVSRTLTI